MENKNKGLTLSYILLESIAMAMTDNEFEHEWYLDIEEGDTVLVSEYTADESLEEMIEEGYGERFISIPARPSHEGWEQMEDFINSLEDQDEKIRDLLLNTISGRGAFSRFKDAVYRLGIQER